MSVTLHHSILKLNYWYWLKTEETSLLAIAAYPTEHDRLKASETAQERIKGQFAPLFSESFRLLGDMVVHHTPNSKTQRP